MGPEPTVLWETPVCFLPCTLFCGGTGQRRWGLCAAVLLGSALSLRVLSTAQLLVDHVKQLAPQSSRLLVDGNPLKWTLGYFHLGHQSI